ncbi:hypothetical protein AsAng_0012650 [Aureispira anguillae]|uniref:Transposase n=1 Tax=Aureispira anguillae TaxID=2864201 RepID=A0A916DRQ7_9BACT|nr:hypothetical protein AsAng_0012650 [Aureispira anguillae]
MRKGKFNTEQKLKILAEWDGGVSTVYPQNRTTS